jgi:hypothetical protein
MKKKTKSHNKQKLLIALKMLACSQARMSPLPPPPPHLLQFGTTKRNRENKRTPETSKHRKQGKKEKESRLSAEQTRHNHLHTRGVWYCKRAAATTHVPTKRELIDKQIGMAGRYKEM